MTVHVSVDELDILLVQLEQAVEVTIDALDGEPVTGTVTGIDTTGSAANGVTKYTVEVSIEKTEQMLSNMNASIEITIAEAEGCLVIPEAALNQDGTETFVYTTYDQETDTLGGKTVVTTGVSDGTNVEVTSGLEEGTTVYYHYSEASESTDFSEDAPAGFSGGGPGEGFFGGRGGMPGGPA